MEKEVIKTQMKVKENLVNVIRMGKIDYISITDLARYQKWSDPSFTAKNWLRRINTIDYVGLWEQLHNPNFDLVEFD